MIYFSENSKGQLIAKWLLRKPLEQKGKRKEIK